MHNTQWPDLTVVLSISTAPACADGSICTEMGPLTVHSCIHTALDASSFDAAKAIDGMSVASRKAINAIQPALRCVRRLIFMGVSPLYYWRRLYHPRTNHDIR